MRLTHLNLNGFRCYQSFDLSIDERINIISGANGAGKTSVLEAIYYLSTGKSFRSKRVKNLINHDSKELTAFTQFTSEDGQTHKLGISLSHSLAKAIKFNGEKVQQQSEIARKFPVVSIDPDSYLFLDKPPQFRRSFLDWLVFHVKPQYLSTWAKVSRCHKQLNSLYKNKQLKQLDEWEAAYIENANELSIMRFNIFKELNSIINKKVLQFVPELSNVESVFFQGWSKEHDLATQINKDRDKNMLYGNLNQGVHKMDIKISVNNKPAHENLSRGQKKLISIIYYLSYIELISEQLDMTPILCLDDMDAELDKVKTKVLGDFILNSNHQVFISTVAPNKLKNIFNSAGMFHVEHNEIVKL